MVVQMIASFARTRSLLEASNHTYWIFLQKRYLTRFILKMESHSFRLKDYLAHFYPRAIRGKLPIDQAVMMNCFCGMVDRQKAFSLISSRDHCQRSSPLRISNMPRSGFEPAQNLSSGLVEWSCAVLIATTLSRARPVIENSFVIIAARWRLFRKPIRAGKENISSYISAGVALHNYL